MPEWVIEVGIGEDRAALIDGDTILAARVCWREAWRAGAVTPARLDHRHRGTRRGAVVLPDGTIAQIDALPAGMTDGTTLTVQITRAALAEQGRFKLAQCRPTDAAPRPAPALAKTLSGTMTETGATSGHPVRIAGALDRSLDAAGWEDLHEQATSGVIDFAVSGGNAGRLTVSPTPAMTLIDIDGPPPLLPLALGAVPAIAAMLARLDLGGSVGIDFPGLEARAEEFTGTISGVTAFGIFVQLDALFIEGMVHVTELGADYFQFDEARHELRGERTGMNGFGLVQLVSRLERPSLLARLAFHPARAAAHALLRQAERVAEPGALLLIAHPAVLARIDAALEAELARRTGRAIRREARAGLALHAGFAQAIAP